MASPVEEEYEIFTNERRWKQVFDRIQNEVTTIYNLPVKHARLPENRTRNRYRDVSPYDDFRVHLECCDNDYINASHVEVPEAGRKYILTQGPLANTAEHFWLMVWQQNSRGVIMLNKVIEDGRIKCHPYFPMGAEFGGEDSLTYENVDIRVEYVKTQDSDYYVTRTLRLVHLETGEEKKVYQFHYIDWPDFGIPKSSETFLSFLYAVRQSRVIPSFFNTQPSGSPPVGPPVIHCSAGIGRSGTFCLVDSALVLVERTRSLATLDLRTMLIEMRKYRHGLIQRPEQLKFSYMAIIDGAHEILSSPIPDDGDAEEGAGSMEDLSESSDSCLAEDDEEESTIPNGQLEPPHGGDENVADAGPTPPKRTSSLESDKKKTEADFLSSSLQPSTVDSPQSQHSVAQPSTVDTPQSQHSVAQPSTVDTPQSQHSVAQPSTVDTRQSQHSVAQHSTVDTPQSQHSVAQPSTVDTLESQYSATQPSTVDTLQSSTSTVNTQPSQAAAASPDHTPLSENALPSPTILSQANSTPASSTQAHSSQDNVSRAPLEESTSEHKTNKETPEPPKRTSSLFKSVSLDEPPPEVPPRPDRQFSAPPIPEKLPSDTRSSGDSDDEESEHGYENTSSSAMKRKREEKNRKTQEMVESMKAKQKAAEEKKDAPWYHFHGSRRTMLLGAVVALTMAVGFAYVRSATANL